MNPAQMLIDYSEYKFVMAVSGGGQEVIGELTKYGGMSARMLEALVPYSVPAYQALIGGPIDQIVSPESARAAAMACYMRARQYAPDDQIYGFASTGAVVKPGGEREGRKHRVCMAIQDDSRTIGVNIVYKTGRTRQEEEALTARCIIQAMYWGSHIFGDVRKQLDEEDDLKVESHIAGPQMVKLIHGEINRYESTLPVKAVFASSCNPLHAGHINIINDAAFRLNTPITLELCVKNADKPPLDYLTIDRRLKAANEFIGGNCAVGEIIPTNKPLFFDKAIIFPGAVFVVGMDTFQRILDPKYYLRGNVDIIRGLSTMKAVGSRFLVYPRKGVGTVNQTILQEMLLQELTTFVRHEDGFQETDISSTEIRRLARAES